MGFCVMIIDQATRREVRDSRWEGLKYDGRHAFLEAVSATCTQLRPACSRDDVDPGARPANEREAAALAEAIEKIGGENKELWLYALELVVANPNYYFVPSY